MSRLSDAATQLEQLLSAHSIRATSDPRDADAPGAFFGPADMTLSTLDGETLTVSWDVYLIAPDNGHQVTHLGELLDLAAPILVGRQITAEAITLPNLSPDPLPALHFTIETETSS